MGAAASSSPPASARPTRLALAAAWTGAAMFAASLTYFLYVYLVRFDEPARSGLVLLPAAVDTVLFSAFALHHSVFARPRIKGWIGGLVSPPLERTLYTVIASILFAIVCVTWMPLPGIVYELPGPGRAIGFAAQALGIAITCAGSRAIDVLDLAGVRPVLRARSGAVAAHVPLSTSGVYAIVRHPIYLGWVLLVFGAPRMTATRLVFAAVSSAYLAVAVGWEERALVASFGPGYQAYQRTVRWRIVPGIF
jgi:hypothetical protein